MTTAILGRKDDEDEDLEFDDDDQNQHQERGRNTIVKLVKSTKINAIN